MYTLLSSINIIISSLVCCRYNGVYDIHVYPHNFVPNGTQYEDKGKYVRFGYITSDEGENLSNAKQASQGSFIILDDGSFVHACNVHAYVPHSANFNAITVGFTESETQKLKISCMKFQRTAFKFQGQVEFELKYSYFQILHSFINKLPEIVVKRLVPCENSLIESDQSYSSPKPLYPFLELDFIQLKALNTILNHPHASTPLLIAGPFGTGKTRLLARAAYDILRKKNSRVLICAHHQASVDTFVEYFGKMKSDENNQWPISFICVTPGGFYHPANPTYKKYYRKKHEIKWLQNERLVITTLSTAPSLLHKTPKYFFTDILIDGGAQTREPETVGPLCFAGKYTRIVIAGDHCQVLYFNLTIIVLFMMLYNCSK